MPRDFNISDETYNVLSKVAGIERQDFSVKDANIDKGLYLIHYDVEKVQKTDSDSEVRNHRGTIIDINSQKIVCSSFGYIPTTVLSDSDKIKNIFKNEEVFQDNDNINYKLDTLENSYESILSNTDFTYDVFPLYEGTMIRVWKHCGEIMISSHKKIDCSNSHWGGSGKFKVLFNKYIGDLNLSDVTDEETVHYFILVDKDLLVSSKIPLKNKDGMVIYIGTRNHLNQNLKDRSWELIDKFALPRLSFENLHNSDKTIYSPDLITKYSEVSKLLTQGFYEHEAVEQTSPLCLGEGVIVSYNQGGKRKHIRIVSEAYKRRSELVDNNPNILHRCYTILTKTLYPKEGDDNYLTSFPPIPVITDEDIENLTEPILSSYTGVSYTQEELTDKKNIKSHYNRFRNAIMWYALSLAVPHQLDAIRNIKYVLEEREKVIKLLTSNFNKFKIGEFEGFTFKNDTGTMNHIKHRLLEAEKFAKLKMKDKCNQGHILYNVKMGVLRDTGEWVFKMARLLIDDRY
jgi:hypothetical protein